VCTCSTPPTNSIDNLLTQACAVVECNYDPASPLVRSILDLLANASAAAAQLPSPGQARPSDAGSSDGRSPSASAPDPDQRAGTTEKLATRPSHRPPPSWAPSVSCTR
jgi:hypothetical protein